MRKCPQCEVDLQEIDLHGQQVDRCTDCKGIYFDKGELESIVHIVKLSTELQLNEEEIDTVNVAEKNRELKCPADNKVMEKREVGASIIDVCPKCQGIWLDDGEIIALKMAETHIEKNLNLYLRLAK